MNVAKIRRFRVLPSSIALALLIVLFYYKFFYVSEVGGIKVYNQFEKLDTQQVEQFVDDDKEQQKFDKEVSNLFSSVRSKVPRHLYDFSNIEKYTDINIDEDKVDRLKGLYHFNPMLTFGQIFKYLNDQSEKGKQLNYLPFFHWNDYVDLSVLNKNLIRNDVDSKYLRSCDQFDQTARAPVLTTDGDDNHFKHHQYCFDHDQIDTLKVIPENVKNHIKSNSKLPFHIVTYFGRQTKRLSVLLNRAYLAEFMPLPYTLTMLLPQDKMHQLNIKQDFEKSNKKLVDSDIFTRQINLPHQMSKFLVDKKDSLPRHYVDQDNDHFHELLVHDFKESNITNVDFNIEDEAIPFTSRRFFESISSKVNQDVPYFRNPEFISSEQFKDVTHNYDWRFFSEIRFHEVDKLRDTSLHGLVKAWLKLTKRAGINTWMDQVSLLSWYWSGAEFPWKLTNRFGIPLQDLFRLAENYNQSLIVDFGDSVEELRYGRYFLDISNSILDRSRPRFAKYEARLIDVDTGLFIEIFGYSSIPGNEISLRNRNNDVISYHDLNPLRLTLFHGEIAYVPFNFNKVLRLMYGQQALSDSDYKSYHYIKKVRSWVSEPLLRKMIADYFKDDQKTTAALDQFKLHHQFPFEAGALEHHNDLLITYILNRKLLDLHNQQLLNPDDPRLFFELQSSEDSSRISRLKKSLTRYLQPDQFILKAQVERYSLNERLQRMGTL
ncbi:LicD family-domain-containing protein [Scheffersomyces amazonensis]|uniref:LicD family-domain-containing protein n=1 Tax=Scheffersomyces amazonensis TaxID=1078765 RepID=UPI00315C726D